MEAFAITLHWFWQLPSKIINILINEWNESPFQDQSQQPGGDGKMKMDLNLKQLDGDPSDTQIGAAAVGLMADAVMLKIIFS